MGKLLFIILSALACRNFSGCSSASDENIVHSGDTLSVGYTYWWPGGGPFTGLCGDTYSMVFIGTVSRIYAPGEPYPTGRNTGEIFYYPQKGIVFIDSVIFSKPPVQECNTTIGSAFTEEKWFTSDCFYGLNLREGDKVMAFLYSYEGDYCIPSNSIIKLESFNDDVVKSLEKYLINNQDPLSISADTTLWGKYGFNDELRQIIDCRLNSEIRK